jgi:DNA-binding CsgD family transcriptional regulator
MANKEIAAGIYASEKAVGYHLRNVSGYCLRLLWHQLAP